MDTPTRVTKHNAAILIFAAQPFTTDVVTSNRRHFRYTWVWHKTRASGFLNANRMPLKCHEEIVVFYRALPTYNPQMTPGPRHIRRRDKNRLSAVYDTFGLTNPVAADASFPPIHHHLLLTWPPRHPRTSPPT